MKKDVSLNELPHRGEPHATEEHLTQTVKWLRKQTCTYYVGVIDFTASPILSNTTINPTCIGKRKK